MKLQLDRRSFLNKCLLGLVSLPLALKAKASYEPIGYDPGTGEPIYKTIGLVVIRHEDGCFKAAICIEQEPGYREKLAAFLTDPRNFDPCDTMEIKLSNYDWQTPWLQQKCKCIPPHH